MTEAEFLKRFDHHLEVNGRLLGEVRDEMRMSREVHERSSKAHEDLRTFIRDITTRNEKVWREVMVGLADTRRGIRADVKAMRESLADMREAIQADTAAVLSMLDRLEGTT